MTEYLCRKIQNEFLKGRRIENIADDIQALMQSKRKKNGEQTRMTKKEAINIVAQALMKIKW